MNGTFISWYLYSFPVISNMFGLWNIVYMHRYHTLFCEDLDFRNGSSLMPTQRRGEQNFKLLQAKAKRQLDFG